MILKKQVKQICALLALCAIPFQGGIADTVTGRVVSEGEPVPYANVTVKGTTIGIAADKDGNYRLSGVPSGSRVVEVRAMGYGSTQKTVSVIDGQEVELNFSLSTSALRGNEIVVTGSRDEVPRKESPVIVSTVSGEELTEVVQAATVSEGLNFATGLRVENDCQNCGFNQLRMNGLEGPYSQILIDGRAVFSAVAGVYGLELIPTNMIERIEVVRGGGSALYGSNAIGGTVNLILKDPVVNSYEFSGTSGWVGVGGDDFDDAANDYTATLNASVVSSDNKMGMTVFGFYRDRDPFDANSDGFSELPEITNTTLGLRAFRKIGDRGKLTADFFTIDEDRRGGNDFDAVEHEADIAESIKQRFINGALTYSQYLRDYDKLSLYIATQHIDRDAYYGAEKQLDAYGHTDDLSLQLGAQYKAVFGPSQVIAGVENNREWLEDDKLGYYDIDTDTHVPETPVADQESNIVGVFGEYQYTWDKLKATLGLRWDNYDITNEISPDADISDDILLPRATLLYSFSDDLQGRLSYASGYRAPQIFDEDLHIESSGSRRVIYVNDPDLTEETSRSYMASVDYDTMVGDVDFGFLVEGFYTELEDPFAIEIGEPDVDGNVIYTRYNAEGAVVKGVNLEAHVIPSSMLGMRAGFTVQSSKFDNPQDVNDSGSIREEKFLRSPDTYGFITLDWEPVDRVGIALTGNYTGEMLVPYFGPEIADPDEGELRKSDAFFDAGLKVRYTVPVDDAGLQFYAGVKNIFNSYQDDFDSGIDRDPGYVYGPMSPRTFYIGMKFGNLL
ncbi:TonB-dependent receptor [Prosthecochloris sp. SCSIO W1103]|uniref:TonB-dependent receptor n=1 Tax=Prosthecochloris sp. SCSIO W1103 TaxID=2992244 RepID=UPI00223C8EEC|nr:TonB-dependent receptor [Prosthecochloris sp. SCSIO W1103]UZJ36958.1 TonB-dependent receptor [Prosthecochloris sp. SCSIO W1103]